MKIRIEMSDSLQEEEIVRRCKELSNELINLQQTLMDLTNFKSKLLVESGEMQIYIEPGEILFLESDSDGISVHTSDAIYKSRDKLYELEQILPRTFMRISKSAIVNTEKIRSVKKNITGASELAFNESGKSVFASRNYIRLLLEKLEENRLRK